MADKTAVENLIQTVADVRQLIEAHVKDPATLDLQKVEQIVKDAIKAEQESRIVHKGEAEAEWVGPPQMRVLDPIVKDGKYAGMHTSDLAFVHGFLHRCHRLHPERVKLPSDVMTKLLTATGSATGDELVLHGLAAQLWRDIYLASNIVSNLPRYNMPNDPWSLPMDFGALTWYKGTGGTAPTVTTPATKKSTLTCTEQVAEVDWEYDLDEDAVIAVMPELKSYVAREAAEQMDYFVLNADSTDADTGNINSDDANPANTKPYLSKGEDGLRHLFLIDNTSQGVDAGGDALTDTDILNAVAKMAKYGVKPRDCVLISDVATYIKGLLNLDGVQTLDKYGTSAVLITGELAAYRGIPIVVSASMHKTAADGKVDSADDGTLGQICIANKNMWAVGFKREMLVEVDRDITKRQFMMVVSFRVAVASHGGATKTSLTHTAGIYNISVA